ncbi:MAG: hypothetical protein ABIO80_05810 [Sphingomicrobium sp.]
MKRHPLFAAASAIGSLAAPPLTQAAYADANQQPVDGTPYVQPGYVQPGHSEPGYGSQNPVSLIIDQLLGDRYPSSDHAAVSVCASAALNQAAAKFRVNGYSGYSGGYTGYLGANRPGAARYPVNPRMRVTSITEVQRGNGELRVKGLIDSGMTRDAFGSRAYQGVGNGGQPYANRYPSANDLSFRCNVDSSGRITSLRVERNTTTYRRY